MFTLNKKEAGGIQFHSHRPLRHNNLKICIPLFDGDGLVATAGERLGIGTGTLMG